MKVIITAIGVAIAAALVVGVYALLSAGPTMLVLGALHSSNGLSAVPALGFWQTLGALFVIGYTGRAFHPSATTTTSSKS